MKEERGKSGKERIVENPSNLEKDIEMYVCTYVYTQTHTYTHIPKISESPT